MSSIRRARAWARLGLLHGLIRPLFFPLMLPLAAIAPAHAEDARVPGTRFHATGEVPCTRGGGQPTTQCRFGVVRGGGGTAEVTVFWPEGASRVLVFTGGTFARADASEIDGKAAASAERDNDLTIVHVGPERFEIPDAVIFGG